MVRSKQFFIAITRARYGYILYPADIFVSHVCEQYARARDIQDDKLNSFIFSMF